MKIAILLSGFIRSYEHLEKIKEQFEELSKKHEIYYIGVAYSILSPSKYHGGGKNGIGIQGIQKTLEENDLLDINKIKLPMSALEIVKSDQMIIYDKDGYDGRCLGQFFMIDKTVKLAEKYVLENNIVFDYCIRCRWDSIVSAKTPRLVDEYNDKIVFALHGDLTLPTDQFFMGPYHKMTKYLSIYDKYYDYLNTEKFQKLTSPVSSKKNFGRFSCLPEKLFRHHRELLFDENEYIMLEKFASLHNA